MSLINQMLQDLEKRGEAETAHSGARYAQFGSHVPVRNNSKYWRLIFLGLGFLLIAFLIYDKFFSQSIFQSNPVPVVSKEHALLVAPISIASPTAAIPVQVQDAQSPVMNEMGLNLKLTTQVNSAQLAAIDDISMDGDQGKKNNQATNTALNDTPSQTSSVQVSKAPVPIKNSELDQQKTQKQSTSAATNKSLEDAVKSTTPIATSSAMVKEVSAQQRAEGEYRQATVYQQQGRVNEAIQVLDNALKSDPMHSAARQLKISLLLEAKRHDDAIRELKLGLVNEPGQLNFSMILARLLVERAKLNEAIEVLQKNQGLAQDRADYLAFLAALQQKTGHHKDAIQLYRQALKKHSQNGVWWMGLGISLQADGASQDAIEAYKQAKLQSGLSSELQAFVDQKIGQLQK